MVGYLKIGEFDKLFNLVGLVNQSDPDQEYLKDAEKIFKFRYQIKIIMLIYITSRSRKSCKESLMKKQIH